MHILKCMQMYKINPVYDTISGAKPFNRFAGAVKFS